MSSNIWKACLFLFVLLPAVTCGGSGDTATDVADSAGLPDLQDKQYAVGPEGGIIETEDGVVLDIPEGALDQELTLDIHVVENPDLGDVKWTAVGPVYSIGPTGQQFDKPILLSLPIETALLSGDAVPGDVGIWTRPDPASLWQYLGGDVDEGKVAVLVNHLSEFAPGADCTPECEGFEFCNYPDGCGGLCMGCPSGQHCNQGASLCWCGDNSKPCSGICCPSGQNCHEGQCCTPDCAGKECGEDGCGSFCGKDCGPEMICRFGKCECEKHFCPNDGCCTSWNSVCYQGSCCTPNCYESECGDNLCGGTCGTCPDNFECNDLGEQVSECVCTSPNIKCSENECCKPGTVCYEGKCCKPDCQGKEGGGDGCGGECGKCEGLDQICFNGACDCIAEKCGDECCPGGAICYEGSCCMPSCGIDQNCGPDDCGGSCGTCGPDHICVEGFCTIQAIDSPCSTPSAGFGDQGFVTISVNSDDCSCEAGNMSTSDTKLMLDKPTPGQPAGGSIDPVWPIQSTDPPGMNYEGMGLNDIPLGEPVSVTMKNSETGQTITIQFTMTEDGIQDVSVECK